MVALSYIICTSPRTGSTLLTEALKGTGRAGRPAEFFDTHAVNEQYWVRALGIRSDAEYVDKVLAAGSTPNGVFGCKLHWHQGRAFRDKLIHALHGGSANMPAAALEAFVRAKFGEPRYIWLRRRNRVAQGISYYRASTTGIWRSLRGRGASGSALDQELPFDFAAIDQHVRMVEEFDLRWQAHFRQRRGEALVVIYEEFIRTFEATVRGVLGFLGIDDLDMPIVVPKLERQADPRSLAWEQRYLQMKAGRAALAVLPRLESAAPQKARRRADAGKAAVPGA
jgi:trehalose 2-sulfotransferase